LIENKVFEKCISNIFALREKYAARKKLWKMQIAQNLLYAIKKICAGILKTYDKIFVQPEERVGAII